MKERNTIQRKLTLRAVQMMDCHPTAEEVYRWVSQEHPDISLATVYRNLNTLAQRGEIQRLQVPGGADRFDRTAVPHYHLSCSGCGCFIDLDIPYLEGLNQQVSQMSRCRVEAHQIVFQGLCAHCAAADRPGDTSRQGGESSLTGERSDAGISQRAI